MWEAWSEARQGASWLLSLGPPHLSAVLYHLLQPPRPAVRMFFQTVAKPKRSRFIGAERVPGVEMAFL